MKLEKIILDKKYDILTNVKNSFVLQAIAYGKIYELLHKQIWRKAPSRIGTYAIASIPTFNGRPVTFIRHWDIKSPSVSPYSYDTAIYQSGDTDMRFGLNQLFVGQDYRKDYEGDPSKNGIYHSDCYITPKMIPATNEGYYDCWGYYTDSYYDWENMSTVYTMSQTFDKQDAEGNVVINNVSLSTYSITTGTPSVTTYYKCLVIDNSVGADTIIELGSFDPLATSTDGLTTGQSNTHYGAFGYRKWKDTFDEFSGHGTYTETQTDPSFSLMTKAIEYGWIRVYEDGTVIEYVPESGSFGGENDYTSPAHYKILPMMYTDTGDLVMDRVEFVGKWSDYFDLIVHEDSEWWEAFVKPIAVIITIIVAYYTGLDMSPVFASILYAGAALSVVGILSGNKLFSLVGGIMMLGASVYNMGEQAATNAALEESQYELTIGQARDLVGFGETFEGLTSIGMDNLLSIGSKIYGIANDIKMLGMEMPTMEATVEDDSGMSITMKDSSEEDLFAELYKKAGISA